MPDANLRKMAKAGQDLRARGNIRSLATHIDGYLEPLQGALRACSPPAPIPKLSICGQHCGTRSDRHTQLLPLNVLSGRILPVGFH